MRLAGKRAFVTGGRQGIGSAIVEAFQAEGADVISCGRGDKPEGFPAKWFALDVSDGAAVSEVITQIG
ncbi:MAG: SDR family NAD(P)-dependent oxidoreductase, partial [Pseudomonadota bacterium]